MDDDTVLSGKVVPRSLNISSSSHQSIQDELKELFASNPRRFLRKGGIEKSSPIQQRNEKDSLLSGANFNSSSSECVSYTSTSTNQDVFHELELSLQELQTHEGHYGLEARNRHVHLDSNHDFIQTDEDPLPPRNEVPILENISSNTQRSTSKELKELVSVHTQRLLRKGKNIVNTCEIHQPNGEDSIISGANGHHINTSSDDCLITPSSSTNHDVGNESPASSTGAVHRCPVPKPSEVRNSGSGQPDWDLPYFNEMQRKQDEERQRAEVIAKIISKAEELDQLIAQMNLTEELTEREARNPLVQIRPNSPLNATEVKFITPPRYFNFTPMTQEEFKKRFKLDSLQIEFEIQNISHNDDPKKTSGATFDCVATAPAPPVNGVFQESQVALPCEFCAKLVPADDLVRHETGCRPELTQCQPAALFHDGPSLIPCEFCSERLPVLLIFDHQNNCRIQQASNRFVKYMN